MHFLVGTRFQLWYEVETSTSGYSLRNDNRSFHQTAHVTGAYFTDQNLYVVMLAKLKNEATNHLPKSRGIPCKSFKSTVHVQIQKLRGMFKTHFTIKLFLRKTITLGLR